MKAWLCMVPVSIEAVVAPNWAVPVGPPKPAVAMLAVYRTKKAARSVHGAKAPLMEVEYPVEVTP